MILGNCTNIHWESAYKSKLWVAVFRAVVKVYVPYNIDIERHILALDF